MSLSVVRALGPPQVSAGGPEMCGDGGACWKPNINATLLWPFPSHVLTFRRLSMRSIQTRKGRIRHLLSRSFRSVYPKLKIKRELKGLST